VMSKASSNGPCIINGAACGVVSETMAIATVEERITRGWCENTSFVFFDAEKYDRFKHVVNFAQSVLDKVCSNVPVHHFSSACTGAHAGAHAGDDAGAAGAGGEGAGAGADADRAGNHAERMLNLQKNSMHIITSTLYLCGFCEGYFATKAKELSSTFFILNGINNINPHLIVITPSTPVVFVKNKKATGVEPRVQVCRTALPQIDVVKEFALRIASLRNDGDKRERRRKTRKAHRVRNGPSPLERARTTLRVLLKILPGATNPRPGEENRVTEAQYRKFLETTFGSSVSGEQTDGDKPRVPELGDDWANVIANLFNWASDVREPFNGPRTRKINEEDVRAMVYRTPGKKWMVKRWEVFERVGLDVFAWQLPLSAATVKNAPPVTQRRIDEERPGGSGETRAAGSGGASDSGAASAHNDEFYEEWMARWLKGDQKGVECLDEQAALGWGLLFIKIARQLKENSRSSLRIASAVAAAGAPAAAGGTKRASGDSCDARDGEKKRARRTSFGGAAAPDCNPEELTEMLRRNISAYAKGEEITASERVTWARADVGLHSQGGAAQTQVAEEN